MEAIRESTLEECSHSMAHPYHGTVLSLQKDRHSDPCSRVSASSTRRPHTAWHKGLPLSPSSTRRLLLPRLLTSKAKPQPPGDKGQQRGGCCREWRARRKSISQLRHQHPGPGGRADAVAGAGGGVREASSRAISHKATGPCTSQAQKAPRFWMLLVHMAFPVLTITCKPVPPRKQACGGCL